MKILGLIGGTTWLSTIDYYRYINEGINKRSGGDEAARCILYSLNFADIKRNADAGRFDDNLELLIAAAENLKRAGAEGLVICANTLHLFAHKVHEYTKLPVIHIAVATANTIKKKNLKKIGLLGTKLTMEKDFLKSILAEQNIETIIPDEDERQFIHDSIFNELGKGISNKETKAKYIAIMKKLIDRGAEGIILGCTEIPLLIKPEDINVPTFDTTLIHSEAAVEFALS